MHEHASYEPHFPVLFKVTNCMSNQWTTSVTHYAGHVLTSTHWASSAVLGCPEEWRWHEIVFTWQYNYCLVLQCMISKNICCCSWVTDELYPSMSAPFSRMKHSLSSGTMQFAQVCQLLSPEWSGGMMDFTQVCQLLSPEWSGGMMEFTQVCQLLSPEWNTLWAVGRWSLSKYVSSFLQNETFFERWDDGVYIVSFSAHILWVWGVDKVYSSISASLSSTALRLRMFTHLGLL